MADLASSSWSDDLPYEPDAFDDTEDEPEITPDPAATRLINLTLALMHTSTVKTRDEIFRVVEGYGDPAKPTDASLRMFERDKDALRELGLPLQTVEDERGNPIAYRIERKDALLPDIHLGAPERAVLALAARAWAGSALSSAGLSAARKLGGAQDRHDPAPWVEPRLEANDPSFLPIARSAIRRRRISFDYQRPEALESQRRSVDVWGFAGWRGRWYFVGHDADRDDRRIFRLSRIQGQIKDLGPAKVGPPDDFSAAAEIQRFGTTGEPLEAQIRVRKGRCLSLRARAVTSTPGDDDWDLLSMHYRFEPGFADALVAWTDDVIVDGPPELRAQVMARLSALSELIA